MTGALIVVLLATYCLLAVVLLSSTNCLRVAAQLVAWARSRETYRSMERLARDAARTRRAEVLAEEEQRLGCAREDKVGVR